MKLIIKTASGVYLTAVGYRPRLLKAAELTNPLKSAVLSTLLQRFVGCRVLNTKQRGDVDRIFIIESIKASKLWGIEVKFAGHEFPFYGCIDDLVILNNLTNYHTQKRLTHEYSI